MESFLPCVLKSDDILGFHVWRHPLENGESEVLGITPPKLRVPAMAGGSIVQPSSEEIPVAIRRPYVAFDLTDLLYQAEC
jgi:hypothetical protein